METNIIGNNSKRCKTNDDDELECIKIVQLRKKNIEKIERRP